MRSHSILVLCALFLTSLTARAAEPDSSLRPCDEALLARFDEVTVREATKIYGAGAAIYRDGRAIQTNRRLLLREFKTDQVGRARRRDRSPLVAFPPESRSHVRLVRDGAGGVHLEIREFWDAFQPFADGFFGEGPYWLDHRVGVRFTRGSWAEWEANSPVVVETTLEGGRQLVRDLAEILLADVVGKPQPLTLAANVEQSRFMAGMLKVLDAVTTFDRREAAVEDALDIVRRLTEPEHSEARLLDTTPAAKLELRGRRSAFVLRYLNDVTLHAVGWTLLR